MCGSRCEKNRLSLSFRGLKLKNYSTPITNHLKLFYGFSKRDWTATIIPAFSFSLLPLELALRGEGKPIEIFSWLLITILHASVYVYGFNVDNQVEGVEEDRRDKPDRPLVSGLIGMVEAKKLRNSIYAIFLTLGFIFGGWRVLGADLLWILNHTYHNHKGGDKHWITKNLFVSIGIFSLLSPVTYFYSNMISTARTGEGNGEPLEGLGTWIIWLGFATFFGWSNQDFRDIDGDRDAGRLTIPVLYSKTTARTIATIFNWIQFALLYYYQPIVKMGALGAQDPKPTIHHFIFHIFSALMIGVVSLRLCFNTTRQQDDVTYRIYCTWFCFICASPFILNHQFTSLPNTQLQFI